MTKRVRIVGMVLLISLGLVAWHGRWFSSEPVARGRTVTEWLNSMAVFDDVRRRDETGQDSFKYTRSPGEVSLDPALSAIVSLGSNAVPLLIQRIVEPPQMTWWARTRQLAEWKWEQIRSSRTLPPPRTSVYPSSRDEARKMAAALALLALGTNQQAGLEILAGARLAGSDFTTFLVLHTANSGLPHRHSEMVTGLEQLLAHSDPKQRRMAANDTRAYPEEKPRWRPILLRLATQDPDSEVRSSALWALATQEKGDPEILALCERTLADPTNPPRMRSFAAAGLSFGGASATNYLPLLQATLLDKDSDLQREARSAIRRIKRSARD